jgi:peptide/nickel transport system substrate-binding protein
MNTTRRKGLALATIGLVSVSLLVACSSSKDKTDASGGGTLTIAMTAANLPPATAGGFEAEGWEGERFVGFQLYDSLTKLDLSSATENPKVIPGLAVSWKVGADRKTWTFKLRPGVKFQDGTDWNADAAVFGFERLMDKSFKYYDATDAGGLSWYLDRVASVKKVDDMTISITTKDPYAYLTTDMALLAFPSPTAIKKLGKSFGSHPVGTGPFKMTNLEPGVSMTMVPNKSYWGDVPKVSKVILLPMPDATARVAALRSGEVDWAENPSPDDISQLKGAGFSIRENPYSHLWVWAFNTEAGPLKDPRVRLALNWAIDRDTLAKDLLQGTGIPATQYIPVTDPGFDDSKDHYGYDPAKAKKLLAEAGYPDGFSMTATYPSSGSGMMASGPMNEYLQAQLAKIGVKVTLKPLEFSALMSDFSSGKMPLGSGASNVALGFVPPTSWGASFFYPSGWNPGQFNDPKTRELLRAAYETFDEAKQAAAWAALNDRLIGQSPYLVVASDNNPRALSPKVHGFVQPRSVWVDLSHITVG